MNLDELKTLETEGKLDLVKKLLAKSLSDTLYSSKIDSYYRSKPIIKHLKTYKEFYEKYLEKKEIRKVLRNQLQKSTVKRIIEKVFKKSPETSEAEIIEWLTGKIKRPELVPIALDNIFDSITDKDEKVRHLIYYSPLYIAFFLGEQLETRLKCLNKEEKAFWFGIGGEYTVRLKNEKKN